MKRVTYPTEFAVFLPTPADPGPPRQMAYHVGVVDALDMEDGSRPIRLQGTERLLDLASAEAEGLELGPYVRDAIDRALVADRDQARLLAATIEQKAALALEAGGRVVADLQRQIKALTAELDAERRQAVTSKT